MNICFKHFVCNRLNGLSVNRIQKTYFSARNQLFVDNKQLSKKNNRFLKNKTEELNAFDSRFGDTFGSLGAEDYWTTRLVSEGLAEDDDNYDVLDIKRGPKMAEIGYNKQLNKLINKRPIQMRKALELYNKMVSEDRIPPHKCTYSLMINGCAKVGFTQKAFELFDEMIKYELRPTKQTITSLFNACSECPFPEFGLKKARFLREWMSLEGFPPNTLHYNCMIKAFGKLGDIQTAFQLVDEMVANGQTTTDQTFCMLLIGCISNKESGLFDAIQVFRRIKLHKLPLFVHTFNLLLKATKECGLGSEKHINSLVGAPISRSNYSSHTLNKNEFKNDRNPKTTALDVIKPNISVDENKSSKEVMKTSNIIFDQNMNKTNIIEINFNLMSKPCNRFMLLGGINGFIQIMIESGVKPDIKTLTLMIELIDLKDGSNGTEKQILDLLDEFKIRADTDFFNIMIKRLCLEKRIIAAKNILQLMSRRGLQPDIVTFGVLSLGCMRLEFGRQLLKDMEELNIKPNIQIMGALMFNGCQTNDFIYIRYLMDYMINNDIKPDRKIIERMEAIKTKYQKMIADYDWNKNNDIPKRFTTIQFRNNFQSFKTEFENWIKCVTLEEEDHPWVQYQFQELPNKKKMHSFVKFMKQKIDKRRNRSDEQLIDEFEEDDLYND